MSPGGFSRMFLIGELMLKIPSSIYVMCHPILKGSLTDTEPKSSTRLAGFLTATNIGFLWFDLFYVDEEI